MKAILARSCTICGGIPPNEGITSTGGIQLFGNRDKNVYLVQGIHNASTFRSTSPRRLVIIRHVITALMTLVTSIMARVARLLVA